RISHRKSRQVIIVSSLLDNKYERSRSHRSDRHVRNNENEPRRKEEHGERTEQNLRVHPFFVVHFWRRKIMSIVITTPTGNIGSRALKQLLQAGADVSVIVRQPEKLSDSIRKRVKVYQGSLTDTALVTKAFQGAKAALWLTPPSITHPDADAYH